MKFFDENLAKLEVNKPENILLLIGYLRGDIISSNWNVELTPYVERHSNDLNQLKKIIEQNKKVTHVQLNEILLIFDKNRISKGFFYFFFVPEKEWRTNVEVESTSDCYAISRQQFRDGVIKFRGIALLKYGNFRYGHKFLRDLTLKEILCELGSLAKTPLECENWYSKLHNHKKTIDIKRIHKQNTWLVGYLSAQDLGEDNKLLYAVLKRLDPGAFNSPQIKDELSKQGIDKDEVLILADDLKKDELSRWKPRIKLIGENIDKFREIRKTVIKQAETNTDIYLTWDYMDVYVATSMRAKWEFDAAYELIDKVFYESELHKWDLRFFDPTQSFTINRLNKGLVESLMLKRAKLTIYLVQEIDSLGKDSELAATLAQGKPVIAYIPKIKDEEIEEYAKRLQNRPLMYFYKRFLVLQSEVDS